MELFSGNPEQTIKIIFELIKILLAIMAAIFTYYTFFREGKHEQRIEFEIEIKDLGIHGGDRIIEIAVIAENKGLVEHTVSELTLTVRGIDKTDQLKNINGFESRLGFEHKLAKTQIVPDNDYFFIRPKVIQRFPLVISVTKSITHINVKAHSIYKTTKEFHTTERAFALPTSADHL